MFVVTKTSLNLRFCWGLQDGEQISTGHILSLTNVTFDSAGTYICVVTVLEIEGMETTGELVVLVLGESVTRELLSTLRFSSSFQIFLLHSIYCGCTDSG